jgi:cytosine deaminase
MDLVIRNATLADGRKQIDIAIRGDTIVEVGPSLPLQAAHEIDAGGDLVSAPFVDAHFHMDATLSYGLPRVNQSGTLLEGIALWG